MAYIIQSLKNNKSKRSSKDHVVYNENRILIFIVILSCIVITVDYIMLVTVINILKKF